MEFVGVKMNTVNMTLYLLNEKTTKPKNLYEEFLKEKTTSLRVLISLLGKLFFTYQAVLPVPLQCQSLQKQQILNLKENFSYEDRVELNLAALEYLKWRCNNLKLNKGKAIQLQNLDTVIQSDATKLGEWGVHCQNLTTSSQ